MGNWKIILTTIDWCIVVLYASVGVLLYLNKKSLFVKYAGLFCLVLAFTYSLHIFIGNQLLFEVGWLGLILVIVSVCIPFCIIITCNALFEEDFNIKRFHLSFLIHPVVLTLVMILVASLKDRGVDYMLSSIQYLKTEYLLVVVMPLIISNTTTFYFLVKKFKVLNKELKKMFPSSKAQQWIKNSGIVILTTGIIFHVIFLMNYRTSEHFLYMPILMIHFFFWLIISLIRYPELFKEIQISYKVAKDKQELIAYDKLGELNMHAQALIQLLATEKLYLNKELDAKELSNVLGIKVYTLSNVLNQVIGLNFNQFVNKYRIEEAKRMIRNGKADNLTIEAIGVEVGFKSKSAFFNAFKNQTGLTPKEYLTKK